MAVSIWFKTSTAAGILLSADDILPKDCSSGCFTGIEVPLLWIGSDGHLDGLKTTATAPNSFPPALSFGQTFASPAAVNNGAWHQAVLIPGQAMYLDGQLVGSGTTSLTLPTGAYALLGTGLLAHSSCGSGCSSSARGRTSTVRWPTCRFTTTSCPSRARSPRSMRPRPTRPPN
jgi:hypothetical protein